MAEEYTEVASEEQVEVDTIQSDGATALVFFMALFAVFFFENIFGIKGWFWKTLAAVVVAFLFRQYWYIPWGAILSALEVWGLGDLIH